MKHFFAIFSALVLLAAGAASAKDQSSTSTMISASPEAVKGAIVLRLTAHGFHLESDSSYQMVFVKEMNNSAGMFAQMMVGNTNCSLPKQVLSFTFAPQGDALLVVGLEQLDKAVELCARERINMDGKKQREAMASFLADIKAKAEAAPAKK